jgi:hypothetical protein
MTDEENDRPAWGKRDPLEVEAMNESMGRAQRNYDRQEPESAPESKPFRHDGPILDGQVVQWDDELYRVDIKPMADGLLPSNRDMALVTVHLLDINGNDFDAASIISARSARDQEALNTTVWDLIGVLERIWVGNQADVAAQEKADRRVEWNDDWDCRR